MSKEKEKTILDYQLKANQILNSKKSYVSLIEILNLDKCCKEIMNSFPRTLYKYQPCDSILNQRLKNISNRKVHYSLIQDFKDDLRDYRICVYEDEITPLDTELTDGYTIASLIDKYNQYIVSGIVKAFCATTEFNDEYMWENYANHHNGFILKFTFPKFDEYMKNKNPLIRDKMIYCFKIEYSRKKDLSSTTFLHFYNDSIRDYTKFVNYHLMTKDYKYRKECEFRFIIKDEKEECDDVFPFYNSIYIGKNVKKEDKENLILNSKGLDIYVENEQGDFEKITEKM